MKKPIVIDVENALDTVIDPVSGQGLVRAGMIEGLQVNDKGEAMFLIAVDASQGAQMEPLRQDAEAAVRALKHIKGVSAILTAEKKSAVPPQTKTNIPDPHGMSKNPPLQLPFRQIIAVASGKGGVGKSTIAANLAVSLAKQGRTVGLLDADIYGPSVPHLMGVEGQKPEVTDHKKLKPIMAHGVGVMSIGFMVGQDTPMIWRGPMVQSAIYQLLRDVEWDGYDTLVIDMPPGTGDAQLTLAQKVNITGAVIVSTSQDLALLDARKAIEMFAKTNVPVLGLVENMSVHVCSKCGHEDHIFGDGHVMQEAQKREIAFLASIPLSHEMRHGLSDECQDRLSDIV